MIKHILQQRVDILLLFLLIGLFISEVITPNPNSKYMLLMAAAYTISNIINKASLAKGITEGTIIFKNK